MQAHERSRFAAGIIAVILGAVACLAQQPGPNITPAFDPRVERILTRLENRSVHDLRARVKWDLEYALGDKQTKFGRIWYRVFDPVPRFKVRFDRKVAGTRADKLNEQHLFDGRWYIELQSETKTLTRREIRRADDKSDPYKLGEGAFPLPFGQTKANIRREFEVLLIPANEKKDPKGTDHLKLTPRLGTRTAEQYKWVDFWIDRDGKYAGLPIRVRAAKRDGTGKVNSQITIAFSEIELNTGFDVGVFEIAKPPGYHEEVIPLDPPGGLPPAP